MTDLRPPLILKSPWTDRALADGGMLRIGVTNKGRPKAAARLWSPRACFPEKV